MSLRRHTVKDVQSDLTSIMHLAYFQNYEKTKHRMFIDSDGSLKHSTRPGPMGRLGSPVRLRMIIFSVLSMKISLTHSAHMNRKA